jgi:hypothetical protein
MCVLHGCLSHGCFLNTSSSVVIPLAKKLKGCNVFGASSNECLNYATQNRDEWQRRGEQIVAEMMEEFARCKPN